MCIPLFNQLEVVYAEVSLSSAVDVGDEDDPDVMTDDLTEARHRAIMDGRVRGLFRELLFHSIYVLLLLVICYGNVDQDNYRQQADMKNLISYTDKVSRLMFPLMLTYWDVNRMADIMQKTISNAFSWGPQFLFWLKCHWILFLGVLLTLSYHWSWRLTGGKLLPEPMMAKIHDEICH